jgi:hypothetical protein
VGKTTLSKGRDAQKGAPFLFSERIAPTKTLSEG